MKNNREFFSPKKVIGAMLCFLLLLCFSACSSGGGGEESEAETPSAESGIYSQEDIAAAIDVIKKEFKKSSWQGCTLTEIYYAGDKITNDNRNLAERYNADEVIVLLSSFDVDASGGDGSLNPNSTYDGWMWILVRTKGGQWQHVDHGY